MSNTNNIPTILETIILQPLFPNKSGIPFTASTGIYTTFVHALSGNSNISFNTNTIDVTGTINTSYVSGGTISGDVFLSGGTNILDLINAAAGGLTGGTFTGGTLTLSSADNTQVQVSGFTDFYTTGATFNPINSVGTFTRNDGGLYSLNLSGLVPTTTVSITGATYGNGTITFKNSTGGTFQVSGFIASAITSTTLTNNILNVTAAGGTVTAATINAITGGTYSAGTITFQGSGIFGSISGFTTGSTNGIDSVLAVGQKFTANRTMDLSGFTLNYNNPHFTYTGANTTNPIHFYPSFPFGTKERLLMNGGAGNRAWDIAYSTDSSDDVICAQGWNVDSTFDPTQPSFSTRMEYQYLGHLYEYHLQWSSADAQRIYRLMSFTFRDQGGVSPTGDSVVLFFKGGDVEFRPLSVDNSFWDATSSYDSGLDQSIMAIRTIGTGLGVYHKLEASNGYHITAAAGSMQEWHDAFTGYKWGFGNNGQTATINDFYGGGYAIMQLTSPVSTTSSAYQAYNDAGHFLQSSIWGSALTGAGIIAPNRANIYTESPAGMVFISSDPAGAFYWSIGAGFPQTATLTSAGQWQWNNYGSGIFTGNTAKILGVTVSGNVIELNASTLSGTPNTIYTSNGTIQANRTVNLSSFTLSFSSTTAPNNLNLSGGNVGIGVITSGITNALHVSATTNPVRIQGLSATTADTSVISVDANGVLHRTSVSNLSGATAPNNFNVFLTGNYSNDVLQPHATIAVKDKFYVGCGNNAVDGNLVCYNDSNDLTNKTTIIPFSAHMNSFYAICYSSVNDRIYTVGVVSTGTSHYNLVTINPNTNTYTTTTLTGVSLGDIGLYGMDTDDTNVYIGSQDNRLFRYNLTTFILTTLTLTGGNIIHDVRYVSYSDGAEIIATSSSSGFPIYTVNPATYTVSSSLTTAPLWTDDMALLKNPGNTVAAGCSFWLGAELGGHCIKYQSRNRVLTATTEEVTSSLSSYGLFTDGVLVYNMSRVSYIEVWPFNLTSGQPIVNGTLYLVGNENVFGVPSWAPNELWISNNGKMFFTNYSTAGAPTDSGIYQFYLSPAPISSGVTAIAATTIYSSNGTLQSNRTVNLSSFTLNFSSATQANTLVLSGGSVGIGTASPTNILHVFQNTNVGTTILFENANTGTSVYAGFQMKIGSANSYVYFTPSNYTFAQIANSVVIQNSNSGDIVLFNATETMRVKNSGNVLIGSTTDNAVGKLQVTSSGNDGIQSIGSGAGRSGFYAQNTNSGGQATIYMDNDRGSFSSYGGFLVGGSANAGTLFGQTRQDKLFMFADGASNLGMLVGTLQAQPLIFGTTNTERMRIASTGGVSLSSSPGAGNGLSLNLSNNSGTQAFSYTSIDFSVPTAGITGQFLATANNYGNNNSLSASSIGLAAEATNGQLWLAAIGSSGFISFVTGGIGLVNERARLSSAGNLSIGTTTDDGVNKVQIFAATNPLRLIGLSSTTLDTRILSTDATGAVHSYAISAITASISGGTVPAWGATLAVSAATSNTWEYKLTDPSSAATFEYITSNDYAPLSGIGRYSRWIDSTFVNPVSNRRDVVASFWSYNMGGGESVVIPNEAAFGFISESYYQQDGTTLSEFHLPIFVDNEGGYHRLWSTYVHRPTGFAYLQSQVGSLSFRHHWDNSGITDWFTVTSGDVEIAGTGTTGTTGAAQMSLSSIGAASGQFVRYTMFDADGGFLELTSVGNAQKIRSGLDLTITPGRYLNMPLNINFNQTDYFSNGTVTMTGPDNTINHGFQMYSLDGTSLLWVSKGQIYAWQPFRVVGSAAAIDGRLTIGTGTLVSTGAWLQIAPTIASIPQINLNPTGATPTAMTNGDIAAVTGHLYYKDSGTTYDLINPASSIKTVTTGYTMSFTDDIILVSASTGPIAITLPAASAQTSGTSVIYTIKKIDNTGNAVTITPPSGQIEFGSNAVLSVRGASIDTFADGTNYYIK